MTANRSREPHRILFFPEDVERLDRCLEDFLRLSGGKCAILVDRQGRAITRRGEEIRVDFDTVAALAAGSFAATREMARVLGEEQFTALTHQGTKDHVHLVLVADRTLLVVLFDERTTLGMVRLYSNDAARRLGAVLSESSRRTPPTDLLEAGYGAKAQSALDRVLGG